MLTSGQRVVVDGYPGVVFLFVDSDDYVATVKYIGVSVTVRVILPRVHAEDDV